MAADTLLFTAVHGLEIERKRERENAIMLKERKIFNNSNQKCQFN